METEREEGKYTLVWRPFSTTVWLQLLCRKNMVPNKCQAELLNFAASVRGERSSHTSHLFCLSLSLFAQSTVKMEEEARLLKAEATASLELAQKRIRQVEKRSERMLKEAMEGVWPDVVDGHIVLIVR